MPSRSAAPSRVYYDHHLDSRRWEQVPLQAGDIILATGVKVGTTWTQRILAALLDPEMSLTEMGSAQPWIDLRREGTADTAVAAAKPLSGRRVFKSHLAFDALPYHPSAQYITVGRDGRDVALSLYNHYADYTDFFHDLLNAPPGAFADPFPRAPDDIHVFIRAWLTRGNERFSWESDGYPFWSHFQQIRSFWDYRDLPNVLLLHYQDLKTDLRGEARRVASFLGFDPTKELLDGVEAHCSFSSMKRDAIASDEAAKARGETRPGAFRGGMRTLFDKGVSGRWKGLFTSEELALYDAIKRNYPPDLMRWLEEGRLASGINPSAH